MQQTLCRWHLTLEDTRLLIAGAVHFVVQLAWDTGGRRCVFSIREVIDADGRQVICVEVFAPGPDRRAVPSAPVRSATMEELEAVGYGPQDIPHGRPQPGDLLHACR